MKALTFFLSLLIVAGVNYEAAAQYSRNSNNYGDRGYTASSNAPSRYNAGYYRNGDRNVTRAERRRYQNDLVRLADRLDDLEFNLQLRRDALDGRGIRRTRRFYDSNSPNRLLSIRELQNWDARLERRANRLYNWERDILRAERRRGNNRGNRGGGRNGNRNNGGNRGGGNGGGSYCPPGWG